MHFDLVNLPWLPPPSTSFQHNCKAIGENQDVSLQDFRRLADCGLNLNQLHRLDKTLQKTACEASPQDSFRLGVLSSATTDFLVPAFRATATRYGIALDVLAAPFGQVAQQAFDDTSVLNSSKFDAILVSIDHRAFEKMTADEAENDLREIIESLSEKSGATLILETIARPPERLFGSLDGHIPNTLHNTISRLNRVIREQTLGPNHVLFDAANLAETVGLARWHDPAIWNLAKLPFSQDIVPLYADHLCRLIAAMRGKAKKCLVLDLDNTLWGGVIGDDGLDGIKIGQGDAVGEAHLRVQQIALDLRARGIILAVSSKNDEATAKLPFEQHKSMLLKESHFAAFQANWDDKASNIEAIAEHLNIGVDSLVLLDDNPVERLQVREALPMVGVPELPDDPSLYPLALMAAGYFEAVAFSEDDSKRALQYEANAKRSALAGNKRNLDDFLASLDMKIRFSPFDSQGRNRIVQLINKTNQFNLTTRRYSASEVERMENAPDYTTLQISLEDRFGDNGIISIIICQTRGRDWQIDTWLMSCRVLNRKVEAATLREIVKRARANGIERIIGEYIETDRNALVAEHYRNLGFDPVDDGADGLWALDVSAYEEKELPFDVESENDARAEIE